MKINVCTEQVDINSLKPHPLNPRQGDVAAIAESLDKNGQFAPIIVWTNPKGEDIIVAGTHTWLAMKSLGEKKIAISRMAGSEQDALVYLIGDNRASDLARYDANLLVDLLKTLPDLEGTGYSTADLERLDSEIEDPDGVGGGAEKPEPQDEGGEKPVAIQLGEWHGLLDPLLYGIWEKSITEAVGPKKPAVVRELKARLDIPAVPKEPKPQKGARTSLTATERHPVANATTVPLNTLNRYPGNAREGDVGAITLMLSRSGQVRPLTVNKRNNQILKGNHTAAAMASIGMTEAAVVYVDVDDEAAARIVLADNRTSDMGTYDDDKLMSALRTLESFEGTGWDDESFMALQVDGDRANTPKQGKTSTQRFRVGEFQFRLTEDLYATWRTDCVVPDEALARLSIPQTALLQQEER